MTQRSVNFGFTIPTPEEDAAIAAGIAADPDTAAQSAADIEVMLQHGGFSPAAEIEAPQS